jgi:hypothetical protein
VGVRPGTRRGHPRRPGAAHRPARPHARYLTEIGEAELGSVLAVYDDTSIVVSPDRWMSWDTDAYDALRTDHGLAFEHAARWYH